MSDEDTKVESEVTPEAPATDDPYDVVDDAGDLAELLMNQPLKGAEEVAEDGTDLEPDDDSDDEVADEVESDIDDDLAARAAEVGLSAEDVELFDSPEALERAIALAESKAEKRQDADVHDSDDGEFVPFKVDLDEDAFDPEVVKTIKEMNDFYAEKFREVYGQLRSEKAIAADRRFDGYVSELGKSFEKLFGTGATTDLDPKSEGARNRKLLKDEMAVIEIGRRERGLKPLDEKSLFERAKQSVFADQVQKITKEQIRNQMRKRNRQAISRPTHKQHELEKGEDKAIASVAAIIREKGGFDDNADF